MRHHQMTKMNQKCSNVRHWGGGGLDIRLGELDCAVVIFRVFGNFCHLIW